MLSWRRWSSDEVQEAAEIPGRLEEYLRLAVRDFRLLSVRMKHRMSTQ